MSQPQQTDSIAVSKTYDFTLWLLPKVENFPRAHRFTVGERLTSQTLDLLTTLVEAAYARAGCVWPAPTGTAIRASYPGIAFPVTLLLPEVRELTGDGVAQRRQGEMNCVPDQFRHDILYSCR